MIDWAKYGFKEDEVEKGLYDREDFPLILQEQDEFLTVYAFDTRTEYVLSEEQIPATNQSVVLLLKAFNCPKLP